MVRITAFRCMKKLFYSVFLCILAVTGCERSEPPRLIISAPSWPDGTCVSLIYSDHRMVHTNIYGGRGQLPLRPNVDYRIRAASPSHITFLSDTFPKSGSKQYLTLSNAVPRRRIGSWRLGLTITRDYPDSLWDRLLDEDYASLTTISPGLLSNEHLPRLIRTAHSYGVEVTASAPLSMNNISFVNSLADSAEVYCVDGIVILPDSTVLESAGFDEAVRGLASVLHKRGLTFSIRTLTGCEPGSMRLHPVIQHIMTEAPAPEQPDELRIAFICNGAPSSVSAERIEEKIGGLTGEHIPLSRISVELIVTAFKFRVMGDGGLEAEDLPPGELQDLLRGADEDGYIRLRDGSLRFGYRGSLYAFDDREGTAQKISSMRNLNGISRSGGIHITYESRGVKPEAGDFKDYAKSAGKR